MKNAGVRASHFNLFPIRLPQCHKKTVKDVNQFPVSQMTHDRQHSLSLAPCLCFIITANADSPFASSSNGKAIQFR